MSADLSIWQSSNIYGGRAALDCRERHPRFLERAISPLLCRSG